MAKRMRKRWWKHEEKVLRRQPDSLEVPHLSTISAWDDDMKRWPTVQYAHIVNYLVFSEGVDGEETENFKSIESYNYFHSGKVGAVYVATATADLLYLKAEVTPSQDVNNTKHQAWVLTTTKGVVETAGCSCAAGLGKTCSHAGSILWKLEYAALSGRTGEACTDLQQKWNHGTSRNLEPKRLCQIHFKRQKPNSKFGEDGEEPQRQGMPAQPPLPPIPQYPTHEDYTRAMAESPLAGLFQIPGSLAMKACSAKVTLRLLRLLLNTLITVNLLTVTRVKISL